MSRKKKNDYFFKHLSEINNTFKFLNFNPLFDVNNVNNKTDFTWEFLNHVNITYNTIFNNVSELNLSIKLLNCDKRLRNMNKDFED